MAYADMLKPEVIEPAIWKSLLAIEAQAVELVPVDLGNLRNSVTIATSKNKKQHGASKDGISGGAADYQGVIGTGAEYAGAVEFGRPDMPNYPAQPFLRPAVDWFRSKIGQITGGELKKQMEYYNIRHPYKAKEIIVGNK
jgi:hypothetical protein